MAVKLKPLELPKLLPWLEQHFPASFVVQGILKCCLKGKLPELDYFVDQWPHPQAVAVVVDPNSQEVWTRVMVDSIIALFGVNSEDLASVLKTAYETFSDWSQPKLYHGIASSLLPILRPLMSKDFEFLSKPGLLLKATPGDLTSLPTPDGMKMSTVTDATVGIVDSTWKYSMEHTDSYIRHLARHFPSVVMTTASGDHVGHMLGTHYGTMGTLYVMPHHRRQGYAKVIITQLAQKYFSEGEDAYVTIEEDNLVSKNLHLSLGFKHVADSNMHWMYSALTKL